MCSIVTIPRGFGIRSTLEGRAAVAQAPACATAVSTRFRRRRKSLSKYPAARYRHPETKSPLRSLTGLRAPRKSLSQGASFRGPIRNSRPPNPIERWAPRRKALSRGQSNPAIGGAIRRATQVGPRKPLLRRAPSQGCSSRLTWCYPLRGSAVRRISPSSCKRTGLKWTAKPIWTGRSVRSTG